MTTINVPSLSNPTFTNQLRRALQQVNPNDTILIAAGSFDIATAFYQPNLIPSYIAQPNTEPYTSQAGGPIGGNTTWNGGPFTIEGAGNSDDASQTTILNARFFQVNTDAEVAVNATYKNFILSQTDGSQNGAYLLSCNASSNVKSLVFDNITLAGSITGNTNAGSYSYLSGVRVFEFKNSIVTITGQARNVSGVSTPYNFQTATVDGSGVLNFLNQSGQSGSGETGKIEILNNKFDESGYTRSFTMGASENILLQGNEFYRSAPTSYVRNSGNTIEGCNNVTISNNQFKNGSYLVLGTNSGTNTASGNTFDGTNALASSASGAMLGAGAVGFRLRTNGTPVGTPTSFSFTGNTFKNVTPFWNQTSTVQTVATNGTGDNSFVNPNANGNASFGQFITGTGTGTATADTLTGSSNRDFIAGQNGNDTLNGGAADNKSDYFLFNTTPNAATNFDTIINWTTGLNGIGSANNDQIVLDRSIFTNIQTVTQSNTTPTLNGRGRVAGTNITANATGVATTTSHRLILCNAGANAGTLYYDSDGTGSTAAVAFARIFIGSGGSAQAITTLNQLGNVLVF